mmetsp:Transcript_9806/g.21244  ORF Transcript_9806/g.21244 Transcript_9806/m.21244 type:complete len:559 (-) Transcript_9806:1386-3062(-)
MQLEENVLLILLALVHGPEIIVPVGIRSRFVRLFRLRVRRNVELAHAERSLPAALRVVRGHGQRNQRSRRRGRFHFLQVDHGVIAAVHGLSRGDLDEALQQLLHVLDVVQVVRRGAGLLPHGRREALQVRGYVIVAGRHVDLGDGRRQGGQRLAALVGDARLGGPATDLPHDREHRLVAVIVPDDQGELELSPVGNLLQVLDDVHRDDALVHPLGTDLHVPALLDPAVQDVHREASQDVGQVILQLPGLEVSELGIGVAVLPQDLHLGLLDVAPVRPRGVHLHDHGRDGPPRAVLVGDERLPAAFSADLGRGPGHEHAVLGGEAQVRDVAQSFRERVAFLAAHHEDDVPLVGTELFEGGDESLGWHRWGAGFFDELESLQLIQIVVDEDRPAVVEKNETRFGAPVRPRDRIRIQLVELAVHSEEPEPEPETRPGVPPRVLVLLHPLQVQHHGQRPALRRHPGHELGRDADAAHALVLGHGQRLEERRGDLGDLPGIHVEGAAHDAGAARELGEDAQSPLPAVVSALFRQRVEVRDGELERDEIEPVPNRRHHHHVRRP